MTSLAQWNSEIAAGTRSRTAVDDLWRRACQEAAATEIAPLRNWAAKRREDLGPRPAKLTRAIGDSCPALVKWAGSVIRNPANYEPLELAAAYELTALECEIAGRDDLASQSRKNASAALLRRSA